MVHESVEKYPNPPSPQNILGLAENLWLSDILHRVSKLVGGDLTFEEITRTLCMKLNAENKINWMKIKALNVEI